MACSLPPAPISKTFITFSFRCRKSTWPQISRSCAHISQMEDIDILLQMDLVSLHFHLPIGDQIDGLGQDLPLRLLHDAKLQALGIIPIQNRHRFLQKNGAGIGSLVDEMYRRTRHLNTSLQRLLMYLETIETGATEGGDQRGDRKSVV